MWVLPVLSAFPWPLDLPLLDPEEEKPKPEGPLVAPSGCTDSALIKLPTVCRAPFKNL